MQVVSGLMIAIACFSVALGIVWYAMNRQGMAGEYRGVVRVTCVFAFACGANRLTELLLAAVPSGVWGPVPGDILDVGTAAVTLIAAARLWPRLSGLLTLPSSGELIEANRKLAAEKKLSGELVSRLQGLNNELEQRVAERTYELSEAKARFEVALLGSNITMAQQNRELRYVWLHNAPEWMLGKMPEDFLPLETHRNLEEAKRRVMETRQPEKVEVIANLDKGLRWYDDRIEPVIRDGEVIGVLSVAIDITQHKRYEKHLFNLLQELTHRSKNLLAVVQGLARQTAETSVTTGEFNLSFTGRLQALSGVHELLVRHGWRGVDLHDLIRKEIDTTLPFLVERIVIRGEPEILGPEAAQNIALGLHELMANTLLEGALATPTGLVDISWDRINLEGDELLEIRWCETCGVETRDLRRSGLGTRLIEQLVPRAIEGTSELHLDPQSLHWILRFPINRLIFDGKLPSSTLA